MLFLRGGPRLGARACTSLKISSVRITKDIPPSKVFWFFEGEGYPKTFHDPDFEGGGILRIFSRTTYFTHK